MSANSKNVGMIITSIITALVIFAVGIFVGIIYTGYSGPVKQAVVIPAQNSGTPANLANILKSKTLSTVIFNGKIDKISGNVLSISNNNDHVSIVTSSDTKVYTYDRSHVPNTTKTASFSDLKIGQTINVGAKITGAGQITASYIVFQ